MEHDRAQALRLVASLDATELTVLVCTVRGMSRMDIAAAMEMTLEDVERVRTSMMTKLGVTKTLGAVRIGLVAGVDRAS